jgi:hypothetical protein
LQNDETKSFQRETSDLYRRSRQTLSLSLSLASHLYHFIPLWRAACISLHGFLHPLLQSVCLVAVKVEDLQGHELRGTLRQSVEATTDTAEGNCAQQLSRFFPHASAVRTSVQVTSLRPGNSQLRESTVVEYGNSLHAIFVSTLPLEFDDHVKLERDRKGCTAEATVIAVQYHEGRKAVAVRFSHGPCDWVTQP